MLNWIGIEVGLATFILIGAFHIIVIKCEYYFSKAVWPIFALIGIASLVASLLISSYLISVIVAVFGITCLWTIKELFEQENRVKKGWFPKNPKRRNSDKKND